MHVIHHQAIMDGQTGSQVVVLYASEPSDDGESLPLQD